MFPPDLIHIIRITVIAGFAAWMVQSGVKVYHLFN